jgi:copper type II ascorbate-dependent monooxygenase-like protein
MLRPLLGCFALAWLSACSTSGSEPEVVTFYEHVAPLAAEHCVGCHQPGEIAPFSLTDYASAAPHAAAIAAATGARAMPPMPVDNSGQCNTYANARWLSDEEIETFQAWAAQGALEGDPALAGPMPPPPAALADADAEVAMVSEYSPNHDDPTHHDDYRCFVLPAPSTSAAFVTAYEVIPGDRRVVHHVIAFQPSSDAAAARARELDQAEAGEGYTCFGGPGVPADLFAGWAPGAGPTYLPEGTGVALAGGRDVVLQVHYNLAQGVFPDRTRVRLRLADGVAQTGLFAAMADQELVLQPGQSNAVTSRRQALTVPAPVQIYGALPHMHELGRTLRLELESGGDSTCLVDVDRWSFHWQNTWWYEAPLTFPSVQALSITCGYDTSSRSDVVTWGEGTADEMCLSYVFVTSPALALIR